MSILKRIMTASMAATLLLLAGCDTNTKSSTDSASPEKTTINLWHQWTNDTDAMNIGLEEAVDRYMQQHNDIEIKINKLENESYKTKIKTEFSGEAKGIDLFFYFGSGRGKQLADANKLLDITPYVSEDTLNLLKKGSPSNMTFDDKLYGLPLYSKETIMFANTELFDSIGAKIPTTYQELMTVCKQFRDAGITPIAQGIKEPWQAAYIVEGLSLAAIGARGVNQALMGEIPFDDPGYEKAAEKTIELYNEGAFGDHPYEVSSADADAMFLTGKAAMRITGTWFCDAIYTDPSSTVQNKIEPCRLPFALEGGKALPTDYFGGYVDTFFINKNVSNPQEVVDFNIYLSKELARIRQESGQGIAAWNIEVSSDQLNEVAKKAFSFADNQIDGVLAWDNILDGDTATTHQEAAQALFSPNASASEYFNTNKAAIGN